jgi:hypothetical protein
VRLVLTFAALGRWDQGLRKLILPMQVELPGRGSFTVRSETEEGLGGLVDPVSEDPHRSLHIIGECPVDPAGLEPVDDISYHFDENGRKVRNKSLKGPEGDRLAEGAASIAGSISFATGVLLAVSMTLGDFRNEVEPETAADEKVLARLGTRRAIGPMGATFGVEVFGDVPIDSAFVTELAGRGIAAVYDDVLDSSREATRFLALWRTLEFAFQAEGKALTDLLLAYPRVTEMGFDRVELEELRAIRGRLSHAVSRAGLAELHRADGLALSKLGRLWSLVDWIVLSKRAAESSIDTDELLPLRSYVDRDGVARLVDPADTVESLRSWSQWSPRFRAPLR